MKPDLAYLILPCNILLLAQIAESATICRLPELDGYDANAWRSKQLVPRDTTIICTYICKKEDQYFYVKIKRKLATTQKNLLQLKY